MQPNGVERENGPNRKQKERRMGEVAVGGGGGG